MINVLFSAQPDRWDEYEAPLASAFENAGLDATVSTEISAPDVDYIVFAPNGPVKDFSTYTNCKAVMSLWAGVETVVNNTTLSQPLLRMVDPALTDGMVEWVVGHTMRHHLGLDGHIHGQNGIWRSETYPPLAYERPVTILGIGALGAVCGQALAQLGFPVTGWSKRPKTIGGMACHHGEAGLAKALKNAQIVVLLLPDTPHTHNVINASTIELLADGAFVINPGRGTLIDDDELLSALDSGKLAHATLDVFRTEPLPTKHRFWSHPAVTVTPHIASTTRPESAAKVIADQIKRGEAGEPFLHKVDHRAGY